MNRIWMVGFWCLSWMPNGYAQTPDTLDHNASNNKKQKVKSVVKILAAPIVLIGLGAYMIDSDHAINKFQVNNWRNDHFPNFSTSSDDVLQFVPIGLVYGLDLLNVKSKNDILNRTLILVKAELMMEAVVIVLKSSTNVRRPDGGNYHSFPSGHTAQAFVAATFMHKELGHKSIWYSIGAYTVASSVGAFRILNNRHWISDVLVGAGIGILSTNLAYSTHRFKWGKRQNLVLLPTYSSGPGLFVSWNIGRKSGNPKVLAEN